MAENKKRKGKILMVSGLLAAGVLIASVAFITIAFFSGREGVVRTEDSGYFRANNIILIGNFAFMLRSSEISDRREKALDSESPLLHPVFYRLKNIAVIEFSAVPEAKKNEPSNQGSSDKWSISLKDYLGEYKINAAGNNGFLYLGVKGGVVYGSVRFPNWGRGMIEPLKNVKISNGVIKFTRSAVTPSEMKTLGITAPFVQDYQGTYIHSGNSIKGTYSVQGTRKEWEALRSK